MMVMHEETWGWWLKMFSQCSCWCGVAKKVPCPLALFFSQLFAVFFLLFSLCGCTNSASANNYSLLCHVGRCIMTADSLWILWRQTYNESSEDKRNNSSRVFYLSIFFNTSSVTAPLTGKPKTQIRCTVVRERIILCSNSVTPPRWINCCCFKCPHLTFAERLDPTQVSAPLRHNHLAHLWNGALIFFFCQSRRPSINSYSPSHISPSRWLWQLQNPNEGRQAAQEQPLAARWPPSIDFFYDPRQEDECSIPNTWRTQSHIHCTRLSAPVGNHWYHLASWGNASFKGQRRKRLHQSPRQRLQFPSFWRLELPRKTGELKMNPWAQILLKIQMTSEVFISLFSWQLILNSPGGEVPTMFLSTTMS